jgi:hypothetical protein
MSRMDTRSVGEPAVDTKCSDGEAETGGKQTEYISAKNGLSRENSSTANNSSYVLSRLGIKKVMHVYSGNGSANLIDLFSSCSNLV